MTGRIVNIETSTHQTVQELLPWFVTDKLEGGELALVQEHLLGCAACRADADWQRKLRAAEPGMTSAPDADGAWARLQSRFDPVPTAQKAERHGRLVDFLRRLNPASAWMPWALAAQFIVIAGLSVAVVRLDGEPAGYRALGGQKNAAGNMVIMFRPDVSEQEIRRILQENGARVVDGPTAVGAYVLHVEDARLAAAIGQLRAQSKVSLAEPLAAGVMP